MDPSITRVVSPLCQYLERHFPANRHVEYSSTSSTSEPTWTDNDLKHHMFVNLAVNTWVEGAFYGFKYEICVVLKWTEVVDECRGTVMHRTLNGWQIATRPFAKFFNQNEPECPWRDKQIFESKMDEFDLVEKADGSCIQLWYCEPEELERNLQRWASAKATVEPSEPEEDEADSSDNSDYQSQTESILDKRPNSEKTKPLRTDEEKRDYAFQRKQVKAVVRKKANRLGIPKIPIHKNGWRISTLGRITPESMIENLFWSFFPENVNLSKILDPTNTYLFELCCDENKVVTKYSQRKMFLIGIVHKNTGQTFPAADVASTTTKLSSLGADVSALHQYSIKALGLHSLEQCYKWIENESTKYDLYGTSPEGFVVYRNGTPIAKMKNKNYQQAHQFLTGSDLFVRNLVIQRYFLGTLDDVYSLLKPPLISFVAELKEKVSTLIKTVQLQVQMIKQQTITRLTLDLVDKNDNSDDKRSTASLADKQLVRKYFIAENQNSCPVEFRGFLFSQFDVIFSDLTQPALDIEIAQNFITKWLKSHYNTWNSLWKKTQVPELIEAEKLQEKVVLKQQKSKEENKS